MRCPGLLMGWSILLVRALLPCWSILCVRALPALGPTVRPGQSVPVTRLDAAPVSRTLSVRLRQASPLQDVRVTICLGTHSVRTFGRTARIVCTCIARTFVRTGRTVSSLSVRGCCLSRVSVVGAAISGGYEDPLERGRLPAYHIGMLAGRNVCCCRTTVRFAPTCPLGAG